MSTEYQVQVFPRISGHASAGDDVKTIKKLVMRCSEILRELIQTNQKS